jgi:hypothetical protein
VIAKPQRRRLGHVRPVPVRRAVSLTSLPPPDRSSPLVAEGDAETKAWERSAPWAASEAAQAPTTPRDGPRATISCKPLGGCSHGVSRVPRNRDCLDPHATVMMRLRSNSIGVSHPSWPCQRLRLCRISRYSNVALASSMRVFHFFGPAARPACVTRTPQSWSCRSSLRCCPSRLADRSPERVV